LVFASAWDRVVSHAHPCEGLSGLQQFNVEIPSRVATTLVDLAHYRIVGGGSQEAAWLIDLSLTP